MDQVSYFFKNLLEAESWPPRWHCGTWSDFHGWLYIFSDLGIWAAYFAIPILLIRVVSARKIPLLPVFWLFAAFILLCGLSHLMDAVIFYYPAYRLSALVRFFTAIISWITVISLIRLLPQALTLRPAGELQHEIAQRRQTEEVLEMKAAELDKANHELDKFVYSVSHDLRAPVASVLGLINLAKDDTTDERQKQYLEMMRSSLNHLDTFIHEIIEYSKNARQNVPLEPVDFAGIYRQSVQNLSYLDNFPQINIRFVDCTKQPFLSDAQRISIIFTNLLSNAIKYHDLNRPEPEISVEVHDHSDELLMVKFRDNGKGIENVHVPRIFDMFYRASDIGKGSGLGLYMVKQVVEKLGGMIEVATTVQAGTEFTVYLKKVANGQNV